MSYDLMVFEEAAQYEKLGMQLRGVHQRDENAAKNILRKRLEELKETA